MESENNDWAVNELDRLVFDQYSNACPIVSSTLNSKDREKIGSQVI